MDKLGWAVATAAIAGLAIAGGVYTAQRTGNPIVGLVAALAFAAVFGVVLFRASRASAG